MAVFAGTWEDEDGKPFDPSAQAAERSCGGKVASVVRNARCPHAQQGMLACAVRIMAQAGWWTLTEEQKVMWDPKFGLASPRRDNAWPRTPNPWIHFVMANAAMAYHDGLVDVFDAIGWGDWMAQSVIDRCSAAEQSFDWTCILVHPFAHDDNLRLICFQCNPRYVPPNLGGAPPPLPRIRGYYNTRLAGTFDGFEFDVREYKGTFPCPFPVKVGDELTCFFRLRSNGAHDLTLTRTFNVTA